MTARVPLLCALVSSILLALPAEARNSSTEVRLQIPAEPRGDRGTIHFGRIIELPHGSQPVDPWASDYGPLTCTAKGGQLEVVVAYDPSNWPYDLPQVATCSQGALRVKVALDFRPPDARAWLAGDGTLVVPVPKGQFTQSTFEAPHGKLARATSTSDARGVACGVVGDLLTVTVDDAETAGPMTCSLAYSDGRVVAQRLVILRY